MKLKHKKLISIIILSVLIITLLSMSFINIFAWISSTTVKTKYSNDNNYIGYYKYTFTNNHYYSIALDYKFYCELCCDLSNTVHVKTDYVNFNVALWTSNYYHNIIRVHDINTGNNYSYYTYTRGSNSNNYISNGGVFYVKFTNSSYTQSSFNSYLDNFLTYTYELLQPTIQPLEKTYNITFLNNNGTFNSVTINGQSSNNSTFDSIETIKYDNNTVYSNSAWVTGYNQVMQYNYEMLQPNVSGLNSDQSIITFTTSLIADTWQYSWQGDFINNGINYSNIIINGSTLNGNYFNAINNIYYDNTLVYSSGSWISGYTPTLLYYYNDTPPDITSLNQACNNIITFTTSVYTYQYSITYNVGAFINNNSHYYEITINGVSYDNIHFNLIDTIYYNSVLVYQNNNFISNYDSILVYYFGNQAPNVSDINSAQNIITFTTSQLSELNSVFDKLSMSYSGMIDIIEKTAQTITTGNIIFIIMCIALPLTMFVTGMIRKLFKERRIK